MPSDRDREDNQFTGGVSIEDVLGVFNQVKGPVVTSSDVADYLDCSRETARRKLREFEEMHRVASRKTTECVGWWLTDTKNTEAKIDPTDPFWGVEPHTGDESVSEDDIDGILYDEGAP